MNNSFIDFIQYNSVCGRVAQSTIVKWPTTLAYKGSTQTCPWSFRMKLGTKIDSNMLIPKIIVIFAQWTCGRIYRPQKSQKIRAAGPGFDREIWKGGNYDNQNISFKVFGSADS